MVKGSNAQKQAEPRNEQYRMRLTLSDKNSLKDIAAKEDLSITDMILKTLKAVYPQYFKKDS